MNPPRPHGRYLSAAIPPLTTFCLLARTARRRLNCFVQSPLKHTHYAVKVLLKYKLLEFGRIEESAFMRWANATPYFETVRQQWFADTPIDAWLAAYLRELISSGAAKRKSAWICNI